MGTGQVRLSSGMTVQASVVAVIGNAFWSPNSFFNLVFAGTADGRFAAYRADTGEKLWEAPIGTGIRRNPSGVTFTGTLHDLFRAVWRDWSGAWVGRRSR